MKTIGGERDLLLHRSILARTHVDDDRQWIVVWIVIANALLRLSPVDELLPPIHGHIAGFRRPFIRWLPFV